MIVYLNGRLVPQPEALLPIHDAGIVSGSTVTDFCRTFCRRLHRWPDHLARFRRDCEACFIPVNESDAELTRIAEGLIERNPGDELALITFATPGPIGLYAGRPGENGPPTLVMHTLPLSFERYRPFFTEGVALAVAGHHGSDPDDLAPPRVKHRSRLHWWRAEQMLRRRDDVPSGVIALGLDERTDTLTETAIGHLLIVRDGVVRTPLRHTVLDGISLRVIEQLCGRLGIPFRDEHLSMMELHTATEAMLTGTAFCLAGVRWIEGVTLPWPGPITQRLLAAWSDEVGVDIAGQFLATT